jgi:hypothetical protein
LKKFSSIASFFSVSDKNLVLDIGQKTGPNEKAGARRTKNAPAYTGLNRMNPRQLVTAALFILKIDRQTIGPTGDFAQQSGMV